MVETNEHIFFQCPNAKPLWVFVKPTIMALLQEPTAKMFKCTLNIFPPNVSYERRALIVTLIQITLSQIWVNRNSLKFDKIQPNM